MIQLHDKQFVPFISAKEIEFAITKMVQQVEDDFIDETPVFIGVLNGSFMVVSDFMKQYTKPCEVSKMAFMKELFYK
jgi:hypoxanthine phosphoribosyltransferase